MSYTYEKTSSLLPIGDYEARIESIRVKTLPNGKEKLSIMYRIRDDVEGQSYGNKCLFEDIWKEKDSPEHFNRKRINQLLGTQEVKDGQVFNSINNIIDFLESNNCLIINVGQELDEYRGEDVNKVRFYKSSKFKPQSLSKEEKVNDEYLPF